MKLALFIFAAIIGNSIFAQGYIVSNGVTYGGFNGLGYQMNVVHDPTNGLATGFLLEPIGRTPPSATYTNTYRFDTFVDVGVRVFLVSSNDPISLQPVLSTSYPELTPGNYVFNSGSPFYVGLYTGNQNFAPTNGIYSDPLFGWAKLVNNQGVIQLLGGALEYGGAGIFAGTQNIIVPEPGALALAALGGVSLFIRRRK